MTDPTGDIDTRSRRFPPAVLRARWWRDQWRTRLWPLALALTVPAVVAMARNQPTRYVGDNRFEQYWAPGWRLGRETMLWDGTRGMGRVGEEFWPITLPLAFLRSVGFSPAVTQHIWHGLLLVLAGLGAAAVVRLFQPRIGAAHLVAGLAYMANPFSISFLVPSNLYLNYVLAPWLLATAVRGIRGDRPWLRAATFALLVFAAGDTDVPGLIFATLWLVPAAVFAVHVERWATWRQVLAWVAKAAGLTLVVSAATLMKVAVGSGPLSQRLLYTETPAQVNGTSSWTESWRGLGYWLSYFSSPGRDPDVPGGLFWFETVGGVLLTMVLPLVALVAAWRLRWRPRLLLGAVALVSLTLMVGSFDPADPGPFGSLVLWAYREFPSVSSMRNTYKAGSGLMIAVAVLAGVGAAAAGSWSARKWQASAARSLVPLGLVLVLAATSMPFWSGGLYPDDRTMEAVPGYWQGATDWLESQPGDARVLVLPGSTQTAYRWGWVGDDILDSLLRRHPNVVPTNFPVSGPITANIVDALERRIRAGDLTAAELAPIARRLGVGWVVLRNDLDWERIREPRPNLLADLRTGGDALPLVKEFGRPGENTTDPDDATGTAAKEAKLRPIEVFAVPGVGTDQNLARPDTPPVLVVGDGNALPTLAADGALDSDRPVRFTGATTRRDVAASLAQGAKLVVTDTNRRRLTVIRGPGPTSSETLARDQVLTQAPQDLFQRSGTQSVATFADATEISASGSGSDLLGFSPSLRPANAFDGLESTAWRAGGLEDPVGSWVRVQFREPQDLNVVTLFPARGDQTVRVPTRVSLHFSDGPPVFADLPADTAEREVTFAPRTSTSFEVRIEAVTGPGTGPVGFNEIELPGLDLAERIAVPDELFTSEDPMLEGALAEGDVSYAFERSIGVASDDEELVIRRVFPVLGRRDWRIDASLSERASPIDRLIDELIGGDVGAYGSTRAKEPAVARGGLAVDGDLSTAWAGAPRRGEELTIRFPARPITDVRITTLAGPQDFPLNSVDVVVGSRRSQVGLAPEPGCTAVDCPRVGTLQLPSTDTQQVRILLQEGDGGGRPARIAEVEMDGPDGPVPVATPPARGACTESVLSLDGAAVPMRLMGDPVQAIEDGVLRLEGCRPLSLESGEHRLDTRLGARVDSIALQVDGAESPAEEPAPDAELPETTVLHRSPAELRVRVTSPDGAFVTTGQSFDEGWTASLDGTDLGAPIEVEGQSAWKVPAGRHQVVLRYAPQRTFSTALGITGIGLLVCVALVVPWRRRTPPPRRRRSRDEPERDPDGPDPDAPDVDGYRADGSSEPQEP